jgi:hypothetical protein
MSCLTTKKPHAIGLVVVGLLFFPAILISLMLFLVSLGLILVCVGMVAVVKFSCDVIYSRNGISCNTK